MKIPIKDITINKTDKNTKRFRKDFGNVIELSESLKDVGQLHPLVVSEHCFEHKKYILIAGERRLRAAIYLGWTEIEVTLKKNVSNTLAKKMELEENVMRKDISWEEQIDALQQIHELKLVECGQATRTKEGWSIEKTAKAIGASVGMVSQDIKLAKQLKDNPKLRRKVKNLNKASARKVVNQELAAEALRVVMKNKNVNIKFDFKNLPCEVGIKEIASNSIHCLITDPPFALDKIATVGGGKGDVGLQYNTTESNVSTERELTRIYDILIPELHRILVRGAHFYMFLGMGWYTRLVKLFRESGFAVDDQPIIWDKGRTSLPSRGAHYMSKYEAILFGHKPPQDRMVLKPTPNVLSIQTINPSSRIHPLQKPFELLKILIENSTSSGETVLDLFVGSGSTLSAAQKLGRNSKGFEMDEGNYLRACKWLDEEDISSDKKAVKAYTDHLAGREYDEDGNRVK